MAKFFETAEDITELAHDLFENTSLPQVGVNLKIMSVTSAKEVLKISKASATMEFVTKKEDVVILVVYEAAFDRLTDEIKTKLLEGCLSNVSYDTEKGKLNVDTSRYGELIRMRHKYSNYAAMIETASIVIEQIAEEERQRKEEEKARKAEEKKNRR